MYRFRARLCDQNPGSHEYMIPNCAEEKTRSKRISDTEIKRDLLEKALTKAALLTALEGAAEWVETSPEPDQAAFVSARAAVQRSRMNVEHPAIL